MKKNKILLLLFAALFVSVISCKKEIQSPDTVKADELNAARNFSSSRQARNFSSEVVTRWLNMQLNMLRVPLAPGTTTEAAERCMAYCGIALYESVLPGMPFHHTLTGQLNQFPQMPAASHALTYHWAASANAALAYMNRSLFPNTSVENNTAINNLETELQNQYAGEVDPATLQRSIDFGRTVAERVFGWAQTDGTLSMPAPGTYILPVGPGLWEKTPPNFAGPVSPFLSMRRLMVTGSNHGTALPPPPAYSTDVHSEFYAMVKNVYDKSQTLTPEQTAAAIYHRDAPGYPGGGTLTAMLSQIIEKAACKLDVAAVAYAKTGIASYEAITICFREKYNTNLVRPITYIRNVMGHTEWLALFNTPGHPEFPAAHATNGAALAVMLTSVFGTNFSFTLDHYNYLELPARNYRSFAALASEMGNSRVWGGIHYQPSVNKGFYLGTRVATNILLKVRF